MTTPSITGKTIWLTGASSGIGKSLAKRLASMGNFVIVSSRRKAELDKLVDEYPEKMHALPLDVSNNDAVNSTQRALQEVCDHLDMVIIAAGTAEYEDNLAFDIAMYQRVYDANFFGAVNTVSIALPLLQKAQQKAHIVGISSLSVVVPFPRAEAYGSSKAALEYFLNTLRTELSDRKFDVTVVRPGFVTTPLTAKNDFPMPFEMPVEDAVDCIIEGVAKKKRQFSFPWTLTSILTLFSWIPWVWYKFITPKMKRNSL